ncbi:TPA: hypothetical protein DDW35_03020 [Candidatus Sumerlaeota bacterium]|jgi:CheY-like chemotaxis protein|nr:hypothetical protein [Candidatus Sumerlaeota bacterium]
MTDNKWRILCIDDEPDILEILSFALGIKHEVVLAHDGLEAIGLLDFCDADFILCDVRMPKMDGFQTVESIRRHPDYLSVPVFFLTAETGAEMAKRGFAAGGNLYLNKPFDPARVLKNIEFFLQEHGKQPRQKRYSVDEVNSYAENGITPPPAKATVPTPSFFAVPHPETSKPRVIVVCQEANQLNRFHLALEKEFECVACADPVASLQRLFSYEPDVLVINPAIPKLSGWGLVQMIRQNAQLKNLPIILVQDAQKPFDIRFVPSITDEKPLVPSATGSDVVQAVQRVINKPGFRIRSKHFTLSDLADEEKRLLASQELELQRLSNQEANLRERYQKVQTFIDTNLY